MKRSILMLIVAFGFNTNAQNCCVPKTNTQEFAMLGKSGEFTSAHELREPQNTELDGKMVSFPVPEGEKGKAYEVVQGKPNGKVILVFQEWWGLNDHIKEQADKLSKVFPGVVVIAPDLYDGVQATDREAASKLMQNANEERIQNIIKGAVEYSGSDEISTIGWCFGGGWSLRAALIGGKKVMACVMYYGMPVRDPEKLEELNAPVLGIFAKQDGWINEKVVGEFEDAMKKAGKPLRVKWYDAPHAFANPSQPSYNGEAAEDAWERTLEFLERNL